MRVAALAYVLCALSAWAQDPESAAFRPAAGAQADDAAARDAYDKAYLWFDDGSAVNPKTGSVVLWTVPMEGKYHRALSTEQFFERVGRPDLAQSYASKSRLRMALILGGFVAEAGGAALGVYAGIHAAETKPVCYRVDATSGACLASTGDGVDVGLAVLAGVLFAGGLTATIAGLATDPMPVSTVEAREMADDYNQKLKASLHLSLSPLPGGASLGLQASF